MNNLFAFLCDLFLPDSGELVEEIEEQLEDAVLEPEVRQALENALAEIFLTLGGQAGRGANVTLAYATRDDGIAFFYDLPCP